MTVDLTTLGFLSSTTTAFLNKDEQLTHLISENHSFYSIENAVKGKENFSLSQRQLLVSSLKKQYQNILTENDEIVNENIYRLLSENTFTVTTGQQLHLFLGPAFMVYKLISTIKAAEYYKTQFPDKNFVPIYWLASEDHDFDEIKDTTLFGEKYTWQTNQSGATGEYNLNDLQSVFEALKQKLEKDDRGFQIVLEFEQFYLSSSKLSEATIKIVHHFFGKYGMVCIDANTKELKTAFKSIIKNELLSGCNFNAFNAFSEQLKANNLSLQLTARPINLFYLDKGIRNRIEKDKDGFKIIGTEINFTENEILNLVENNPEKFSPNAVLRPLYQETILPNIAYIGGNAEINYWIQLKNVFETSNIIPPKLVLRQSAWFISEKTNDWLKSKKIEISLLFKSENKANLLSLLSIDNVNIFENYSQQFIKLKSEIQNNIALSINSELKQIVELGKNYEKALKNLEYKFQIFLTEKNQKSLNKLEQIKTQGFDRNNIQERVFYSIEMMTKIENFIEISFKKQNTELKNGYFLTY